MSNNNFVQKNNQFNKKPLTIGIVAGEASGDSLGADLMKKFNQMYSNINWVGVGGAKMQAQGLQPLFDISRLAVMGLVEVIKHLPDLLKARKELLTLFTEQDIDCFIGIDAPDFNLRVAKHLKPQGIYCVQYVSPSVWAWRESRIHNIKQSSDLVLCLFPFELPVYKKHHHPAVCVGHPLLTEIDEKFLNHSPQQFRNMLTWQDGDKKVNLSEIEKDTPINKLVCVMPGSRDGEINAMFPLMLDGIQLLIEKHQKIKFVVPTVSQRHQKLLKQMITDIEPKLLDDVYVMFDDQQFDLSKHAMAASDVVLLASGTATLEAMLLATPMVVIYKLNQLTYQIAKRLVKVPFVSLPNILSNRLLVAELIQQEANTQNIVEHIEKLLLTENNMRQVEMLKQASQKLKQESSTDPVHAILDGMNNTKI